MPSKLYPILAAGRPVLAVAPSNSDVARIVRRECGVVADPDDPGQVASAIQELAEDHARLRRMAQRAEIAPDYER